ncbi:MAG: MFS transporter [Dehalococcoidia bacterium]|nr:MFS transporter [Dehalococcoidia bacterium]
MSKYLIFAVASLSLLIGSISGTAVAVAFPAMIKSFDASLLTAGWVMGIYQLTATAVQPLAGKASDALGRKFIFMLCVSLFTIGSVLCAIAPNIELLIFFRLIQAMGGGGFMPSAAGMVVDEFPRTRQRTLGLFTSIFPIGQIIGPNLGGWMTEAFGWRSIFWFNIPLGVIAFIASAILLRPQPRGESQIDVAGAGLFTGSLAALMVGLTLAGSGEGSSSWALFGLLFVVSAVLMLSFFRRQSRVKNPFIDVEMLRHKPFIAANIYNFMYGACVVGIMSFIPLYAVSLYGMSVLESGVILTPRSIGMIIAASVTSVYLVRWGYRLPMLIGTSTLIVCLFLLGAEVKTVNILGTQLGGTFILLSIMLLTGLGSGISSPASNNACIDLMPDRIATITGIRGMFRLSGGAISIAIVSLVLHNAGDLTRGFFIVFSGLAFVLLLTLPVIFMIPGKPDVSAPLKESGADMTGTA